MTKSMTGYGKAAVDLPAGRLTVEIRTLNGKTADISIKSPLLPKDRELQVRQMLSERLVRGTVDMFITLEAGPEASAKRIDAAVVADYYRQLREIRDSLPGFAGASVDVSDRINNELLTSILRFPDVVSARKEDIIDEENWPQVESAVKQAVDAVDAYRISEGAALYRDVESRVRRILELENEVESYEEERISAVKERILKAASDLGMKLDGERFEQEMIYYLEKNDINEEKVRLRQHCAYFMQTLDSEPNPGRKLGFIIQEMGREINTTGSKANHAGIQKAVVKMKDELEKIREQSMNIL